MTRNRTPAPFQKPTARNRRRKQGQQAVNSDNTALTDVAGPVADQIASSLSGDAGCATTTDTNCADAGG